MFTGENVLVCCVCPNGGIWESGTMVEAEAAAAAMSVEVVAVPAKTAASEVALLLR